MPSFNYVSAAIKKQIVLVKPPTKYVSYFNKVSKVSTISQTEPARLFALPKCNISCSSNVAAVSHGCEIKTLVSSGMNICEVKRSLLPFQGDSFEVSSALLDMHPTYDGSGSEVSVDFVMSRVAPSVAEDTTEKKKSGIKGKCSKWIRTLVNKTTRRSL